MRTQCVSAILMLGLVAGAHADTTKYEKEQFALFQKYAGAPVSEFSMFELFQWQVVGPQNLVAWSTIRDAYLITVDKGCARLEWTNALSLTRAQKWKVSKTFDFVEFQNQRCKITEIRPIDLTAMRKDNQPLNPPVHSANAPAEKS